MKEFRAEIQFAYGHPSPGEQGSESLVEAIEEMPSPGEGEGQGWEGDYGLEPADFTSSAPLLPCVCPTSAPEHVFS